MLYRQLGKTDKQVSVIGIGLENVDGKPYEQVKETIDEAISGGVNFFDVFMPGREVRENIARALRGRRDKVMIQGHIGSTEEHQQYDISRDLPTIKRYFSDLLRMFDGYIDFGMMFFIDSDEDYSGVFDTGFADYVQQLKQEGKIGHVGFSSHNPKTAVRVIQTGLVETMMFSINPAFDLYPAEANVLDELHAGLSSSAFRGIDPQRADLYKLCEQKSIGVTSMKTLGAGKLISPEHSPFARPMTVGQCLHYALSRPAVASALIGCKTAAEVKDTLRYLEMTDDERDYTHALTTLKDDFRGNCVYCSHCQPCPVGIDIAAVNKYLDIAKLNPNKIPPSVKSHYGGLDTKGDECIACGNCEKRCPFAVPIIENMRTAATILI